MLRAGNAPGRAGSTTGGAHLEGCVSFRTPPHSRDPAAADIAAVATAVPNSRVVVIYGQQHLADILIPDTFAKHVVAFLRETSP
jgi:hypothetical protein